MEKIKDITKEKAYGKREQNKINCRNSILKASRRLFKSCGYEDAMMEDIAAKAGVSKATVYNYFPTKESLLIGTANEVIEHVEEIRSAGAPEGKDSEYMLLHIIKEFTMANMKYPDLARRITYLNSCPTSSMYHTGDKMIDIIRAQVKEVQADGIYRSDVDTEDIVHFIMGLYYIVQYHAPETDDFENEELEKKLEDYFHKITAPFRNNAK